MERFSKGLRQGEKGFTLVELLIVVAILGVLAAVIIPNVTNFTKSGQKAAGQAEMSTVQTAVYAAMADNGTSSYSTTAISSTTDGTPPAASWLQGGLANLKGSWTTNNQGQITSGTYPGWTYSAGVWTQS